MSSSIFKTHLMILHLTLLCSHLVLFTTTFVSAQCQGNLEGLVEQCSRFVQKNGPRQNPTQACCDVVKTVDFPCVCAHVTPDVEQIISMEKAVFVAGFCGKPLQPGTKCGSYQVHEAVKTRKHFSMRGF